GRGPAGEGGPWGTPDAPPWGPPDEGMGWEAPPAEPVWDPPGAEPAWNGSGAATTWDDPPPAPESSPAAPDWAATAASTWDPPTAEPMPDPWADPQEPSAAPDRFLAPPAPTVPTGWVDDATVPLGDETIPLGYTGELFLPRDLRQPSPPAPPGTPRNGSTNGGPHHLPYDPSATTPGRETRAEQPDQSVGGGNSDPWVDEAWTDEPPSSPPPPQPMPSPAPFDRQPASTPSGPVAASGGVDPETRLWNARSFRERLTTARDESRQSGSPFSVVMIQVADQPFQTLPYRRQVAVLRELGHQFIQARMIDHLVHLPDGAQHWFAVVLPDADRGQAHQLERRLRSAIASYLRSRGLQLGEVQSASLTSPDDDQAMGSIWASLLGPTSVS
ncbi:MAG: GGDEF domain-containing protein, partial [Acidimicrobiales bacterium]